MKNSKTFRAVFGLILLVLFFIVLKSSIKNRGLEENIVTHSPDVVTVTEYITVYPEISPEPEAENTPEPTPTVDPDSPEGRALAKGLPAPPDIDVNSWEFMLANADNSIDEYAPANLVTVGTNDQQFDVRIEEPLKAMIADAQAQGLSVFVSSGYRSYSDQASNFIRVCNNNGVADGKNSNGFYITMPAGKSEHQTGLAADITDVYYPLKDSSIENTALFQYLKDKCQDFGFIVRFPKDMESITGVMYEPFHFRYVGVDAAKYIMENGLCLEEFLALYRDVPGYNA